MEILDELIVYAQRCIDDIRISEDEDYISGEKHKQACMRFLSDIKRCAARNVQGEEFPYIWNEEEAEKIVKWFFLLRHSKGELSGQPIVLTPWQKFVLCQIYGWRHEETGNKRFKRSFVEVGRKNAKEIKSWLWK